MLANFFIRLLMSFNYNFTERLWDYFKNSNAYRINEYLFLINKVLIRGITRNISEKLYYN